MASASWHKGNNYAPTVTLTIWEHSQLYSENRTTVGYSLVISRPSNISSSANKWYSVVIDGTEVANGNTTIGGSGDKTIVSGYANVWHNSDGTKSFSFSFYLDVGITWSGTALGNASGSGTMTLSTIPRAATCDSAPDFTSIENPTMTFSNPGGFGINARLEFNGSIIQRDNIPNTGSYTFNLTTAERELLCSKCPNSLTMTVRFVIGTKIGSSSETDWSWIDKTMTVAFNVVPTITSVTLSEAVEGISSKFNAYIQNKSKISGVIVASGICGSSITKCETTIQSVVYSGTSFTSSIISASGTVNVVTKVTDSRGRTAQLTKQITVLAYSAPVINLMKSWRINTSGEASEDGERIAMQMNFAISSVNSLNDRTYKFQYRLSTAETFTTFETGTASLSYNDTEYFTETPEFSCDNSYVIRLEISDYFQTVVFDAEIPTGFALWDVNESGKGFSFGKVSEKDCLEIALDVEITGELIQEDRQSPTLLSNWVNYESGFEAASYWKDTCNVVHISGVIKSGTADQNTVIFTLPSGYRPRAREKFITVSANALCVINVGADGNVIISVGANTEWISLCGINFRAV